MLLACSDRALCARPGPARAGLFLIRNSDPGPPNKEGVGRPLSTALEPSTFVRNMYTLFGLSRISHAPFSGFQENPRRVMTQTAMSPIAFSVNHPSRLRGDIHLHRSPPVNRRLPPQTGDFLCSRSPPLVSSVSKVSAVHYWRISAFQGLLMTFASYVIC